MRRHIGTIELTERIEALKAELEYTNGVANQFAAEEAEEWRRYAMELLDVAKDYATSIAEEDELGPGSRRIYYHCCCICGATWRQDSEPEEHRDGCVLVPALWSDKLAEYMKTPLPERDRADLKPAEFLRLARKFVDDVMPTVRALGNPVTFGLEEFEDEMIALLPDKPGED